MDKSKVNVIAAMLARGNMGMPDPDLYEVTSAKSEKNITLDSAVVGFCQQFMESDDHYDLFMGEAEGFVAILNSRPEEESARVWARYFDLYDRA